MKLIFASTYIVCIFLFGWTINSQSQILVDHRTELSGSLSSESSFYPTGLTDMVSWSLKMESKHRSSSDNHKFHYLKRASIRRMELVNNVKTSLHFLIANALEIHFKGPDIIHPFNYFW